MNKHTPGPWERDYSSIKKDGKLIALTSVCDGVADNARLIASSPDLLEALRAFMALGHSYSYNDIKNAQDVAQAAIAKATGESK